MSCAVYLISHKSNLYYSHLDIHQMVVHHVSLLKPSDVNIVL